MRKDIPIHYEEPIEINEVEEVNYFGNDRKKENNKFELWYYKYIRAIVILIICFCFWYFTGRTDLDRLSDKMQQLYTGIENRNDLIIKLVDKNKTDQETFKLIQKDFIEKTNAIITNTGTITFTWWVK